MRRLGLERAIFGFSSLFAKVGSVIFLLLLVVSLLAIPFIGVKDTQVDYLEVKQAINQPEPGSYAALKKTAPNLNIPEGVEKYLSGDNRQVFLGWIENMESDQQQEFTNNLEDVIKASEKNSDDVIEMVNKYKELKLAKLSTSEIEKYAAKTAKAGVVGFAFGMAVLVVLMSVVLLLIAIERNTRKDVERIEPVQTPES